ncbi:hypothetical protein [Streptomyces silaceus]|uniref:hypothetical protein n=1 Tax=Streptomyces silaceus TaxID=545123 RepID=UPI0006EB4928|nr:hypothetical protein [Streptomyces silaceus]
MIADTMTAEEQRADEAYRLLLSHTEGCGRCRANDDCEDERRLARAWRALRSAAAHTTGEAS